MKTTPDLDLTQTLAISRRRFMGFGAALMGGAIAERTFAALPGPLEPLSQAPAATAGAWRRLKQRLSGELIRHGQFGYTRLSTPNNQRYRHIKPAGIAVCTNAEDVATCLRWCQEENMPLATRGGGHSYAGYSSTHGLLISLSSLGGSTYDASSGRVTIGGGMLNGALYKALGGIGRSVTHGRCTGVGAGGFLLGGGIGFEMRAHGIGSDKLVSTEIVTADGAIRVANAASNADLFWACRGGAGGNFGINTAFTLETFPVDRIVVFDLSWRAAPDELIATVVRTLEAAPNQLGAKLYLEPYLADGRHGEPALLLRIYGQFHGSEADLRDIFAPLTAAAKPGAATIETLPYWEGQYFLAEEGTPACYQSRSRFVDSSLPDAFIAVVRQWMNRWEPVQGGAYLSLFLTGGAINDVPADATAFVHRWSRWLFDLGIGWDPTQSPQSKRRAHRWQDGCYAALVPIAGGGAFQNFVDPSLEDWETAYYGSNLPRIRAIKRQYDPGNRFRFPQSIRPA